MKIFGMLKRFWVVWIAYWLLYCMQPIQSSYQGTDLAFLLQLSFALVLSIAYCVGIFLVSIGHQYDSDSRKITGINPRYVDMIILWGLRISLLGTIFLAYDKIFIQEIDYSSGLAEAREQWRRLGEERAGSASSILSVLGYFFAGAIFMPMALICSRILQISNVLRFKLFMISFLLLMMNSLMTGGRSSILLMIAFASFGYYSFNSKGGLWGGSKIRFLFILAGVFSAAYIIYIFYSRALASDLDVVEYALDFLEYLNLLPSTWFADFVNSSSFGWFFALINLAVSYLTHSLVTTAAIIGNGDDAGNVVFVNFMSIGAKLGLNNSPSEWFLAGRFPSLPGALYMQFGILGLLCFTLILGLVAGFFNGKFFRNSGGEYFFLACASAESTLLLSPFLFAGDFLFFPFMLMGGLLTIFVSKFLVEIK